MNCLVTNELKWLFRNANKSLQHRCAALGVKFQWTNMSDLKKNTISWTWQRVFSAVFAAAGTMSTLLLLTNVLVTGTWPYLTSILVCFVMSPFGSYLFGCYACTGALPKFMQHQNLTGQSTENRQWYFRSNLWPPWRSRHFRVIQAKHYQLNEPRTITRRLQTIWRKASWIPKLV